MIKKTEEKKSQWNTTVKIPDYQVIDIKMLVEKLGASAYRSLSDFVVKSVDSEIRLATFRSALTKSGRYHFDLILMAKLQEAYEQAYAYDNAIKNVPNMIQELAEKEKKK